VCCILAGELLGNPELRNATIMVAVKIEHPDFQIRPSCVWQVESAMLSDPRHQQNGGQPSL
jgi:hypothetical protein